MVVRPYPQVQTLGPPQAAPQTVAIQPGTPVTIPAPPVHHAPGQPTLLTEGQVKVIIISDSFPVKHGGYKQFYHKLSD